MTRPYVLKTITATAPCSLVRVRLNQGGYDTSGAYWGRGAPLYYFQIETTDSIESGHIRAGSREVAKTRIRDDFGHGLKFYR